MGLEPTTFSLGSWNGWGKARGTSAVRRRLGATSLDKHSQDRTPGGARTSADGSGRGSGDGAAGRHSTPLQAFGLAVGRYAGAAEVPAQEPVGGLLRRRYRSISRLDTTDFVLASGHHGYGQLRPKHIGRPVEKLK
jgi:hypothetical protein